MKSVVEELSKNDSVPLSLCPRCDDVDCVCTQEDIDIFLRLFDPPDPLSQNIIFAQNGVTLAIEVDEQSEPYYLRANLSYLEAVEWRERIWGSFPEVEIEIDWSPFYRASQI